MNSLNKTEWLVIVGLLLLSFVPCVGGIIRLVELGFGIEIMPLNPRVISEPTPVVIHIAGSIPYCILGIFQFLPTLRIKFPKWHRKCGCLLILLGILAAMTGLWMTHFYEFPNTLQGPLLYWARLSVGFGMIASILIGIVAIIKKNITRHKASMTYAYAIAQGAGTQVIITLPWILTIGEPSGLLRDILMITAWLINLYVAHLIVITK